MDINAMLRAGVESVVERLEDSDNCAFELLRDALEYNYMVDSSLNFIGAEILMSTGGPSIVIDVRFERVVGNIGGTEYVSAYTDNIGIWDTLEENFSYACESLKK